MAKYTETEAPEDDLEGRVLDAIAGEGSIYVMIVAVPSEDGEGFDLRLPTNSDVKTVKSLLRRTMELLPDE